MHRLSSTVMLAKGLGIWKLRARPSRMRLCAACPTMSCPSKRMLPSSFLSVPAMQLTSVLLPEPFGPMRPTRSPGRTMKSTRSSAVKPPNLLVTPETSSSASLIVEDYGADCPVPSSPRKRGPRDLQTKTLDSRLRGNDELGCRAALRPSSPLAPPPGVDPAHDAVRGERDEEHQQHAHDEQVPGRRNRHLHQLLHGAEQNRADERPHPAHHAADARHGDAVHRVRAAERRARLEVGNVVGKGGSRHAH